MNTRHALFAVTESGHKIRCSPWSDHFGAWDDHTLADGWPDRVGFVTVASLFTHGLSRRHRVRYLAVRGCDDPQWWGYDARAALIEVTSPRGYRTDTAAARAALVPLGFYGVGGMIYHDLIVGPVARGWVGAAEAQGVTLLHCGTQGIRFVARSITPAWDLEARYQHTLAA